MTNDDLMHRIDRVHDLIRRFAADPAAEVPVEVAAHRLWEGEWDFHLEVVKSRVIAERAAETADSRRTRDVYSIDIAWDAEQAQWRAFDRDDPNQSATAATVAGAFEALVASSDTSPPGASEAPTASFRAWREASSRRNDLAARPGRPGRQPMAEQEAASTPEPKSLMTTEDLEDYAGSVHDLIRRFAADLAAEVPVEVAARRLWDDKDAYEQALLDSREAASELTELAERHREQAYYEIEVVWDPEANQWHAYWHDSRPGIGATAAEATAALMTHLTKTHGLPAAETTEAPAAS